MPSEPGYLGTPEECDGWLDSVFDAGTFMTVPLTDAIRDLNRRHNAMQEAAESVRTAWNGGLDSEVFEAVSRLIKALDATKENP